MKTINTLFLIGTLTLAGCSTFATKDIKTCTNSNGELDISSQTGESLGIEDLSPQIISILEMIERMSPKDCVLSGVPILRDDYHKDLFVVGTDPLGAKQVIINALDIEAELSLLKSEQDVEKYKIIMSLHELFHLFGGAPKIFGVINPIPEEKPAEVGLPPLLLVNSFSISDENSMYLNVLEDGFADLYAFFRSGMSFEDFIKFAKYPDFYTVCEAVLTYRGLDGSDLAIIEDKESMNEFWLKVFGSTEEEQKLFTNVFASVLDDYTDYLENKKLGIDSGIPEPTMESIIESLRAYEAVMRESMNK